MARLLHHVRLGKVRPRGGKPGRPRMSARGIDQIVQHAWIRAAGFRDQDGARCECARTTHEHDGRCQALLRWERRGDFEEGGWEAAEPSSYAGCQILCGECYALTTLRHAG